MAVTYNEGVFNDKNPVKRWLQRRRLESAIKLVDTSMLDAKVILDFGAANGELCKLLAKKFPAARIVCYEPAPQFFDEATVNLRGIPNIDLSSNIQDIALGSIDLIFCLEVFEHIPKEQTSKTIKQLNDLLASDAAVIFGVPVEIGLPALYKGLFRMTRRFGAFDARPSNILRATLGFPPKVRPLGEVAPGLAFYYEHLGFDHRRFRETISAKFRLEHSSASPFGLLGTWFNPEAYFVVRKNTAEEMAAKNMV